MIPLPSFRRTAVDTQRPGKNVSEKADITPPALPTSSAPPREAEDGDVTMQRTAQEQDAALSEPTLQRTESEIIVVTQKGEIREQLTEKLTQEEKKRILLDQAWNLSEKKGERREANPTFYLTEAINKLLKTPHEKITEILEKLNITINTGKNIDLQNEIIEEARQALREVFAQYVRKDV